MELLDHLKHPDPRERSAHGGTFTGNPVTLAAGYALVSHLSAHRQLYERFNGLWNKVRAELDKLGDEFGLPCHATGEGSMIGLHFTTKRPVDHRTAVEARWSIKIYELFHLFMRLRGVLYMTEQNAHFFASMAHGEGQAKKLVEAAEEFMSMVASDGAVREWMDKLKA